MVVFFYLYFFYLVFFFPSEGLEKGTVEMLSLFVLDNLYDMTVFDPSQITGRQPKGIFQIIRLAAHAM